MNIAFWGAFDWESLGDTMFPKVLGKVLRERVSVDELFLFSLTEKKDSYNGNGHVYALDSFGEIYEKYLSLIHI